MQRKISTLLGHTMAALVGQDLHLQLLITEALSTTCRKYFSGFKINLTVAGTIGITVDNSHVCIVQISDDLRPDMAYSTKHLGEHPLDRRPAACANQHVCVAAPSDSGNIMTNNTIVIEPSMKKHKRTVQSWNNTQSGSVHTGLSASVRNTRLLTPENSSLLSLLTSGTKPEDTPVTTEKPLAISAVWGSVNKVYVPNREPLPAHCNDAALNLCTGSEPATRVVSDQLRCASPSIATAMQSRVTSVTDSDGTSDTSCTSHIDGHAAQFLQQLVKKGGTEGMTGRSSRPLHLNDCSFGSAAKQIKLEVVETLAKRCNSSPPNSTHVTKSLPSVSYDCTESGLTSTIASSKTAGDEAATQSCITHAPSTEGGQTQMKPVVMAERDEVSNKNSSAFVDMESLASAPPAVKSESAKAKVRISSTGRNCRSEKSEIDLTTGTAMTMNDLVDFYIRKEIFHNRK